MLARIRIEIDALRDAPPGQRFLAGYERTHVRNYVLRLTLVGAGVALMLAAAVTFWLPGPNFVLVFAGLALVGGQSRLVARGMDRVEVAGRRWYREAWVPSPHQRLYLAMLGATAVAAVAATGWYAVRRGWVPFLD